jgi:predicted nuclease of predicted toxin-antitoxin system
VKIKLDENIHRDVLEALASLGHDVATVSQQGLAGRADADIANAVQTETRCLVTSDLDFADPRRYPPQQFTGLVVLRLSRPTIRNQVTCLTRFFADNPEVSGHLWIVEDTRARDWTP